MAEPYETIPEEHIERLLQEPQRLNQFNEVYGAGRGEQVLRENNPMYTDPSVPLSEEPDPASEQGFVGRVAGQLVEGTLNTARGGVEAGRELANSYVYGPLEAADELLGQTLDGMGIPNRVVWGDGQGVRLQFSHETQGARDVLLGGQTGELGDTMDWENPLGTPDEDDVIGNLVAGFSQFGFGSIAHGPLTGFSTIKQGLLNGALADAFAFNPDDPNITRFAEEMGIDMGVITDIMGNDPDDPEILNRARNALEGAVIGGALEGLTEVMGWALRGWAARRAGRAEEALQSMSEAERLLDELIRGEAEIMLGEVREVVDFSNAIAPDRAEMRRAHGETIAQRAAAEAQEAADALAGIRQADGEQIEMDVGDTPRRPSSSSSSEPVENRIYITPRESEEINYLTGLASNAPRKTQMEGVTLRGPNTYASVEDFAASRAAFVEVKTAQFRRAGVGNRISQENTEMLANQRVVALAKLMGKDPEALWKEMKTMHGADPARMDAEILAQSKIVMSAHQELRKLRDAQLALDAGQKVDLKKLGVKNREELGARLILAQETFANADAIFEGNASGLARAMRTLQMTKEGHPKARMAIRDMNGLSPSTIAMISARAERTGRNTAIDFQKYSKQVRFFADLVNGTRINFLLSGPGTMEVNFVSNLVNSVLIPTEQLAGGAIKSAITGDTRGLRHAARQFRGRYLAMHEYSRMMRDAIHEWDTAKMKEANPTARAFWKNEGQLDPYNTKIDDEVNQRLDLQYEKFGRMLGGDRGAKVGKVVGNITSIPSRVLLTQDEMFKQAQYRGAIWADALQEADDLKLKGTERDTFVQTYLRESYDEAGGAAKDKKGNFIREEAMLQAQRSTFTDPLDPGFFLSIQKLAVAHPPVRFILPFVRTPVNIFSQTIQHMPVLGVLSKRLQADFNAGGARQAQAIGKQSLGAAMMVGVGLMASQGMITGAGPSDPRLRNTWLQTHQPYSFRWVNSEGQVEHLSFARYEPISNIMSVAADAVYIQQNAYGEDREEAPALRALMMSMMDNSINKTFTQGLYEGMAFAVGQPYEQDRAFNNALGSFVPNIINQLNGDDTIRETRGLMDNILARTWMYDRVDVRRNVLGEPIIRGLPKWDPLGLFSTDVRDRDLVMEEILRMGIIDQTVSGQPGRRIAGPNKIDLSSVNYGDTNQSLYDAWVERTGTIELGGVTLRDSLARLIQSPAYQMAPPGMPNVRDGSTKSGLIADEITRYRRAAQNDIDQLRLLFQQERIDTDQGLRFQREVLVRDASQRTRELFPSAGGVPGVDRPLPSAEEQRALDRLNR